MAGLSLERFWRKVDWFFGNSLHGKSRMFMRRHSDPPCPNSNSTQGMNLVAEKSMEETYSSIKKIPEAGTRRSLTRTGPGLMKTASMTPTNVKNSKESSTRMYSTMKQQFQMQCGHYLSRAPSLPTFADDEESEFSMGKLIRQASLNHARVQPPLPSVKNAKKSSGLQDMKAQIKFWARAVASNVRQEC